MVRHHVKKKKGSTASSKKQQSEKELLEAELENLDRFAGSSDEESNTGDVDPEQLDDNELKGVDMNSDESSDQDGYASESDGDGITEEAMKDGADSPDKQSKRTSHREESESSEESDDDYKNEDSDEDKYNEPHNTKATGMSNAMTRILGGASLLEPKKPTSSANVVLSKTTTPLQRLQQKIKNEEAALRLRRRERRTENLSAMRLPLAPTAGMSADKLKKQNKLSQTGFSSVTMSNAQAIAAEIESERTHRRIATRGVVALFNAISKHRSQVAAEAAAKEEEKKRLREEGGIKRKAVSKVETSKHGFLDMIKSAASTTNDSAKNSVNKGDTVEKSEKKGVGWSALKDDFMMNSKLKVCLFEVSRIGGVVITK